MKIVVHKLSCFIVFNIDNVSPSDLPPVMTLTLGVDENKKKPSLPPIKKPRRPAGKKLGSVRSMKSEKKSAFESTKILFESSRYIHFVFKSKFK